MLFRKLTKCFRVNPDVIVLMSIPFKITVVIAVYRADDLIGFSDIADVVMFFLGAVFTFELLMMTIPPTAGVDSSYVAAVYEHNLILNPDPRVPLSRLEALQHLQKNLDIYEDQTARAAQQVPTGVLSYIVMQ